MYKNLLRKVTKRPYIHKTEQWARELARRLFDAEIGWHKFFSEIQEDLWRLQHSAYNKDLYIKALAKAFESRTIT